MMQPHERLSPDGNPTSAQWPIQHQRLQNDMSLQAKLQVASSEFQKLQLDLSNVVESRQRLEAQLSENELVKKEFDQLKPENVVYKQIGPVLVKQDQAEARSNVVKRLEFIRGEMKRVETQLKDLEQKNEKKKNELLELQTTMQQQAKPEQQKLEAL